MSKSREEDTGSPGKVGGKVQDGVWVGYVPSVRGLNSDSGPPKNQSGSFLRFSFDHHNLSFLRFPFDHHNPSLLRFSFDHHNPSWKLTSQYTAASSP